MFHTVMYSTLLMLSLLADCNAIVKQSLYVLYIMQCWLMNVFMHYAMLINECFYAILKQSMYYILYSANKCQHRTRVSACWASSAVCRQTSVSFNSNLFTDRHRYHSAISPARKRLSGSVCY
jgi:hypothetical protein